jgi:hypothetical protein
MLRNILYQRINRIRLVQQAFDDPAYRTDSRKLHRADTQQSIRACTAQNKQRGEDRDEHGQLHCLNA